MSPLNGTAVMQLNLFSGPTTDLKAFPALSGAESPVAMAESAAQSAPAPGRAEAASATSARHLPGGTAAGHCRLPNAGNGIRPAVPLPLSLQISRCFLHSRCFH